MGKASGGKRFHVSENTPAFYEESQRQKAEEFREKYRKRAVIEQKNAELRKYRTIKVVNWRVDFLTGDLADFAGYLDW